LVTYIVRFHVPMHDSIGMTIIQRFQKLVDVVSNVIIREGGIQDLEVGVIDVLKNETWRLRLRVANNVQKLDDIFAAAQVLQYFYLSLDLLLFHLRERSKLRGGAAEIKKKVESTEKKKKKKIPHNLFGHTFPMALPPHIHAPASEFSRHIVCCS
jgi:hypothetical protein